MPPPAAAAAAAAGDSDSRYSSGRRAPLPVVLRTVPLVSLRSPGPPPPPAFESI